jgi:hypothetical protein
MFGSVLEVVGARSAAAASKKAFAITKGKLKQLQQELETLKSKPAEASEDIKKEVEELQIKLEAMTQRDKSYQEELFRTNLKATDEYKLAVDIPRNEIYNDANTIATANNVSLDDVMKVISETGDASERHSILSQLSDEDKLEIITLKKSFRNVVKANKDLRSKQDIVVKAHQQATEKAKAVAQKRLTEESEAHYQNAIETFKGSLAKDELFDISEEDDKDLFAVLTEMHNVPVKQKPNAVVVPTEDGSAATLTSLTPADIGMLVYNYGVSKYLSALARKQQVTIGKLYAKVKKLSGATPSGTHRSSGSDDTDPQADVAAFAKRFGDT